MRKSRYTNNQVMAILKQAEASTHAAEPCREHGMSSATFYKERAKYGGTDASLMARMKELEEENCRFKTMYAEERIKVEIVQAVWQKKWCSILSERRWRNRPLLPKVASIRLACIAFGIRESGYRSQPKLDS